MIPVGYSFQADPHKWKAFRARCDKEGRKVIWVIKAFIDYYINYGLPEPPESSDKKDKKT